MTFMVVDSAYGFVVVGNAYDLHGGWQCIFFIVPRYFLDFYRDFIASVFESSRCR